MKHFVWILALVLASCSDTQLLDEVVTAPRTQGEEINVNTLINRARWGDGRAFLQLADCYRNGKGVKQDFLGMIGMVVLAEDYGGIKSAKDYLLNMPDDNEYMQLFKVLSISESHIFEKRDSIKSIVSAMDSPDAYAIRGILALEENDSVRGFDMLRIAEEKGSVLAAIACVEYDLKCKKELDIVKFENLAVSSPIVYQLLAYLSRMKGNDRECAEYLLKAEEHAMLGRRDVWWLLDYCKKNDTINLSAEDRRRIENLVGIGNKNEIVADSVCTDSIN